MSKTPEVLKTQPAVEGAPGAGGWTPEKKTPLWAAVMVGTLMASGPAIGMAISEWNTKVGLAVGVVLMSLATSLGAYFGIRSAGTRTPQP